MRFWNVRWLYASSILCGVLVLIYISASKRTLPISQGTNHWYYGNINNGVKFGFKVGTILNQKSPQSDVKLIYYGSGNCMGVYRTITGCSNQLSHASFEIRQPLYYGQVFVEHDERGIITSIIWNADAFPLEWVA
jgi:hypothetical protein